VDVVDQTYRVADESADSPKIFTFIHFEQDSFFCEGDDLSYVVSCIPVCPFLLIDDEVEKREIRVFEEVDANVGNYIVSVVGTVPNSSPDR